MARKTISRDRNGMNSLVLTVEVCSFKLKGERTRLTRNIEMVRTKHMENATFEQIYEEVEDYANSIILESIKVELLEKVKKFIDENVE
ncbi:unnamed protein product [Rhizopus microsporus]